MQTMSHPNGHTKAKKLMLTQLYEDPSLYHSLGGILQFFTFTREDNVVQQFCLFTHNSMESHIKARHQIIGYVKVTLHCMGFKYFLFIFFFYFLFLFSIFLILNDNLKETFKANNFFTGQSTPPQGRSY